MFMKRIVVIVILLLVGVSIYYLESDRDVLSQSMNVFRTEEEEAHQRYVKCMSDAFVSDSVLSDFESVKNDYLKKGVSIYFEDLNNQYSLMLNENKVYYSASLAKIYMVIYLLEGYRSGNIDLEEKLIYKPSDAMQGSIGMKKHKYYDEVSINELIMHMLMYSDNTAYFMLLKYVGLDTLKEYFKEYNLVMEDYDPFVRNYTASMGAVSLKRLYSILDDDDEYSKLVKDAMNNVNMNYLNFSGVSFLHKYGYYDISFHDIGIYDNDNPYVIVVLTLYGNGNYQSVVNDISKKMYSIYARNLEEKEKYCNKLVEKS